jgi:hypothetical protein
MHLWSVIQFISVNLITISVFLRSGICICQTYWYHCDSLLFCECRLSQQYLTVSMSQMMWSAGCIIVSLHYPKGRTSLSYLKVKFIPNDHLQMTILSQSLITSMLSIHRHSTSCSHDLLSIHRQDKDFECLHHLTHATCHDVTPSDRKQILVMLGSVTYLVYYYCISFIGCIVKYFNADGSVTICGWCRKLTASNLFRC